MADKLLYIGSQSKEFFKFYGVPEHKLVETPYSVDNDFFTRQYIELKDKKTETLAELNLPQGKNIILFTAKYGPQKRPLDLLMAFAKVKTEDALLVMVGDGPLRPQIEEYIKQHNLANVVLTGFINQSAISKYYSVASVFVMCSGMGETWGLSVNEAMNFGLPVVVSKTCGCSYDLIKEGVNGFTFEEGDIDSLAKHLDHVLSSASFAVTAAAASREIIKHYSISKSVEHITTTINAEVG